MAEGARLESVCTSKAYRGFESLPVRPRNRPLTLTYLKGSARPRFPKGSGDAHQARRYSLLRNHRRVVVLEPAAAGVLHYFWLVKKDITYPLTCGSPDVRRRSHCTASRPGVAGSEHARPSATKQPGSLDV